MLKKLPMILFVILSCCNVLYAAPLAYWQFENDFTDSSGNGHDLSLAGSVAFSTDTSSQVTGYYSADFSNTGYLTATGYTAPLNNFTFEMSFKTASTTTQALVTTLRHTTPVGGWYIYMLDDGSLRFKFYNGSTRPSYVTSVSYNDNEWHDIAFSMSNSYEVKVYIDGNLETVFTGTNSSSRYSIRLGAPNYSVAPMLDGLIDEIRVSEGVLEISELLMSSEINAVPEPLTIVMIFSALITRCFFRKRMEI